MNVLLPRCFIMNNGMMIIPDFFSSLQVPLFALFLKGGGSTLKKNAFAGGGEAQLERLAP